MHQHCNSKTSAITVNKLNKEDTDSLKEKLDEIIRKKSEQTSALKKLLEELNKSDDRGSINKNIRNEKNND